MAESQITLEANNVTPPLKNTTAMKCIAVLIAGGTSQAVDLATLFGNVGAGHYYTAVADGIKCYVALGNSTSESIDETAWGQSTLATATLACIPIADGTQLPFRLVTARQLATGVATQTTNSVLLYKGPTGTATGYLRLYRSSLGSNEDAGVHFKGPLTGF